MVYLVVYPKEQLLALMLKLIQLLSQRIVGR